MFKVQDQLCTHCNFCGDRGPMLCYAARTARHGLEGNFPSQDENLRTAFGHTQSAGEQFLPGVPRFKALRDIVLIPELLGSQRVAYRDKLGVEPLYIHVNTQTTLGGFMVNTPVVVAAMGSTPVANSISVDLGMGAARGGFVYAIGENVVNMWGYEERIHPDQPTLKDRIRAFTRNQSGMGGVVVQQNVEDARAGVWKRVYGDPELKEYFDAGLIGFEAKGGQGAKPGMGGEVKVPRQQAQRLSGLYHFPVDPFVVEQSLYQRHSVPGTATVESLHKQLQDMVRQFPKARIWFKTGPYGDLMAQIQVLDEVAAEAGIRIHLTVDGTEGGTGMSPLGPMNEMGLPMLSCLMAIQRARKQYTHLDYTIAGGLVSGRDFAKVLCLGADGIAFGKAMLVAAMAGRDQFAADFAGESALVQAGAHGVVNFALEGVTNEARMLISSVGKYDLAACKLVEPLPAAGRKVSTIDVLALDEQVARMFGLLYAYDPQLWDQLGEATAELRRRQEAVAAVRV
ncbi:MAG: alpha-hydroxy-acid oxidizing protein [Phycisphaeraceae bacterium]|nr:alpha-hydroxy-acid oxidizing protein [Phycisphaeraceae bacterium]